MNKISLVAASVLLAGTMAYAGGDIEPTEAVVVEDVSSPWSYSLSMESRIRPNATYNGRNQGTVNQLVFRNDVNYAINDEIGIFGSLWFRDRQSYNFDDTFEKNDDGIMSDRYTTNNDYITAIDVMLGAYYSVNQYFTPYVFALTYFDNELANSHLQTSLGAIGFSGTAWKSESGNQSLSYYFEQYFGIGQDEYGVYEDWFDNAGSETAVKYSYSVYDNTSLYYQPTWYVFGARGYSQGALEHRFGIKVSF